MKFSNFLGIRDIKELIVKKYNQDLVDIRQWWDEHNNGSRTWDNVNATNATITNLTATTFTPTGIKGTTTNDSAVAGNVGEYINASNGASYINFPATTVAGDLLSISLTGGDWDVSGLVNANLNGATMSGWLGGISTTTGNSFTGLVLGDTRADGVTPSANYDVTVSIPAVRVSLASTTTVYLKYYAAYTAGQPRATGRISARRTR